MEFSPENGGQGYQPIERVLKPGQWIQNDYSGNTEVIVSSVMIQGIRPVVKLSKDLEMEIVEKVADDLIWQEEYKKARESHAVNGEVLADTTYKDGMLYRKGKIWLPHNEALKKLVFENEHDTMVAAHMCMDRDPVLTSTFWAELMKKLNVPLRKSTAFRPQTDGQTERINQPLKHYLRQYCDYEQNDWYEMLPLAEYSYNNSVTTATQIIPFYANYGFHPCTTCTVEMELKNPASKNYAHWISSVHDLCNSYLKKTSEKMGRYYDKSKKTSPPFKAGDLVMLNGKNVRTRRAAKKLDAKQFGPFKVVKLVERSGMSVELELPKRWRVHNMFHTSLLEPYRASAKGLHPLPIAVTDRNYVDRFGVEDEVGYDVDGQQVVKDFEVEEIMGSEYSTGRKKVLYLIKWKGYPVQSEWIEEPLEHLPRVLVQEFHKRHPEDVMDDKLKKEVRRR